jgi:CheY-like chemotaxis protein
MFVRTDEVLDVGQDMSVELSFPGLLSPIRLRATVAWRRDRSPALPAGVGVRFDDEDVAAHPELFQVLEQPDDETTENESREGPPEPLPPEQSTTAAAPYRILVIEDNEQLATLYRHALRRAERDGRKGFDRLSLEFATDGSQALHLLLERSHDLLLLDLFMPELDGFTVIERIRAHPRLANVKIMAISGAGEEALTRALSLGADAVVAKPTRLIDIVETASTLLRRPARPSHG